MNLTKKDQTIITVSLLLMGIVVYLFQDEIFRVEWFTKYSPLDADNQSFSTDPDDLTIVGCLDENAENYNPLANYQGDGVDACFYTWGCCNPVATNYDALHDSCDQPNNDNFCLY